MAASSGSSPRSRARASSRLPSSAGSGSRSSSAPAPPAPHEVVRHLRADRRPLLRFRKTPRQGGRSPLQGPAGSERGAQRHRRGVVGILVGPHRHALRPGRVDHADGFSRFAPGIGAQHLHVADHAGDPGLPGDGDHLVDGRQHPHVIAGLVADVAGVDGLGIGGRRPRHRHLLGGVGVFSGHVEGTRRQSESARVHRLTDQLLHAGDIVRRSLAVGQAHDLGAQGSMADQRHDVDAGADRPDLRQLRPDVGRTAAVGIDHHGGDSLVEGRQGCREFGGPDLRPGVGMDVDQARGDEPAPRIDDAGCGGRGGNPAHLGDAVALDSDVGRPARRACPIEHHPAANEQVEVRRLRAGRGGHRQGQTGPDQGDPAQKFPCSSGHDASTHCDAGVVAEFTRQACLHFAQAKQHGRRSLNDLSIKT